MVRNKNFDNIFRKGLTNNLKCAKIEQLDIKRIRRRIEDYLRKCQDEEVIDVAHFLHIKID